MWSFLFGTLCGAVAFYWWTCQPQKNDLTALSDSYNLFRSGELGPVVIVSRNHREKYCELMVQHYAEIAKSEYGLDIEDL